MKASVREERAMKSGLKVPGANAQAPVRPEKAGKPEEDLLRQFLDELWAAAPAIPEAPSRQEAYEVERMMYLGRMVSAVAHELNNRLTSVLGFADLLALKGQTQPDTERLAGKLKNYTESLRGLAEGLNGFSSSRGTTPAKLDVVTLVRQAVDLAACEAKAMGVCLRLHLDPDLPRVAAVSSEFRLGLFICLDYCVRRMARAEKDEAATLEVEVLRGLEETNSIRIVLRSSYLAQQASIQQERLPEAELAMPELKTAAQVLSQQGGRVSWFQEDDKTWKCVVEWKDSWSASGP